MLRTLSFVVISSVWLAACSPALNWREVSLDGGLKALLPCKPDHGSRQMPLAGRAVEMQMVGCEAGGAMFAVAHVKLGGVSEVAPAQASWQAAMLANMQASTPQLEAYSLKGAGVAPTPVRLSAQGRRSDGHAVVVQGVWFAKGEDLYHAVIYADKVGSDMAEPFFSGFEFQ
ncbi:MAG: hypothetical protein CK604_13510 [Curvibacter sp. PD_MW3]|nr:MAG: hypothetical protein CK604_13510 [Curvibacter sp. PD_MW3]